MGLIGFFHEQRSGKSARFKERFYHGGSKEPTCLVSRGLSAYRHLPAGMWAASLRLHPSVKSKFGLSCTFLHLNFVSKMHAQTLSEQFHCAH